MPWTDYAKQQMFAIAVTGAPEPTNFYLALYVNSANPAGSPDELALSGYARQICTLVLNSTDHAANGFDISFGILTAGSYLGVAVLDDPAAGNTWFWADEGSSIVIPASSSVTFAAGDLLVQRTP